MHPHQELVERFYRSFSQRNSAGMMACYSPQATFSDAVFTLHGKAVGAMWHMLCDGGQDLEISFRDINADYRRGQAHWEARYTFSTTGRKVHNLIDAEFIFQEGRSFGITITLISGVGREWLWGQAAGYSAGRRCSRSRFSAQLKGGWSGLLLPIQSIRSSWR